jgi:hypothetical protein
MDNRSDLRACPTPTVHLKSALGVGDERAVALRPARKISDTLRVPQGRVLAFGPYRNGARDDSLMK